MPNPALSTQAGGKNMKATTNQNSWIKRPEAARRLGVSTKAIARMIDAGHLTTRHLPGTHPRVLLADVERIAQESVRPARA